MIRSMVAGVRCEVRSVHAETQQVFEEIVATAQK